MGRTTFSVKYMIEALSHLDHTRSDALDVETAYLDRLVRFAEVRLGPAAFPASERRPSLASRIATRLRRRAAALVALRKITTLVPLFVGQARKLARIRKSPQTGDWLIVAMASNRLSLHGESVNVPEQLASLTRAIGRSPNEDVARKMLSAPYIFLFDPLPLSRLWPYRRKSHDDNVVVIDSAFLFVYFVITLFSSFPGRWITMLQIVRECHAALRERGELSVRKLARTSAYAMMSSTYSEVFRGERGMEAVFLTSNSTLTELLRAYLIDSKNCYHIAELMHGVGSIQAERCFADVMRSGQELGAYEKHFFIPQVPIPLYGVFKAQEQYRGDLAINPYLNQYFIRRENDGKAADEFDIAQYRTVVGGDGRSPDPIILTLFGGTSSGKPFYAGWFGVECLLISLIGEFRKELISGCVVVYVPHPFTAGEQFDHPLFVQNDVRICRSSPFCWLITDLGVSLQSSAMFEAAYFGARMFTPLTEDDNTYPASYLDLVSHPKSKSIEDCVDTLRSFIIGYDRVPRMDVVSRARERLKLMRGGGLRVAEAVAASGRSTSADQ